MTYLKPGVTKFFYDGEELLVLEGAQSVPVGTRVEVGHTDYIVDTVRIRQAGSMLYDLYYECHIAEQTGARAPLI